MFLDKKDTSRIRTRDTWKTSPKLCQLTNHITTFCILPAMVRMRYVHYVYLSVVRKILSHLCRYSRLFRQNISKQKQENSKNDTAAILLVAAVGAILPAVTTFIRPNDCILQNANWSSNTH